MTHTPKHVKDKEAGASTPAPVPASTGWHFGAVLEWLARALALAGGMLLIGVMGMTVLSVFGRYLFNAPVPGDYELTELACGIAVFAFFPYCHIMKANIVVDFFTRRLHTRYTATLDAVHNIAFTFVAGLMTWRLCIGGMRKFMDGEMTLFLGIPVYGAYFSAVLGAGLLTAICVLVVYRNLHSWGR